MAMKIVGNNTMKPQQQALQELALPHHDDCFGPRSARNVVETLYGLAHPDEPVKQQRSPAEEHPRDG
jgi:hypothetical protein